ncbi:MAG TPA: FAD-dependent oxidoreductase, partial [Flavobacterium sp.]|nr:FAD-dependent oxidoreductase [Flavobacterium sp.]
MNNDKPIHSFDTVIIGSGLGGLATALLLAKSGQSVAVLEKNNQFGGNLQTFSRDKKLIDTGVHYVGGMGEGQNLYRYFSHLDILPDLEWEALDEEGFDRIYFDSHKKYIPQAQGYTRFVDQLVTYFPEHQQEIENYIETVKTYCNAFPMYRLNFEDRYQTEYLEPSVQEVMDALISNPELKAVLLGSNFLYALQYEKTPFYVHALTVNSYIQSAWRCVKGGSQITKALIKQLRKYHVKLFKYQEVQRFETVENTIVACETATDRFVANRFVSNIDLKKTYSFLPKELQKKPSIKRVVALKMTPSVLSVHLTLKEQTIKYFNHNIYHYDSQLIDLTAIASGFTPEYVEKYEQRIPNGLLDKWYSSNYAYVIVWE